MLDNSRARAATLLLVVFVVGVLVGIASTRTRVVRRALEPRAQKPTVGIEQIPTPLEALGLSDSERVRLRAIARRWRPRANDAVAQMRSSVSNLENGMFAEMLCALTPEQRDRYRKQLEANQFDPRAIEQRFALVSANRCAEVHD